MGYHLRLMVTVVNNIKNPFNRLHGFPVRLLSQTWNMPVSPSRGIGYVHGASMMEKGERERNVLTAAKSWKFGAISLFRHFTGRTSGGRSDAIS